MQRNSKFFLRNELERAVAIHIEPEGVVYPLASGQELAIEDCYDSHPVTLTMGSDHEGRPALSVWPGDGNVRVESGGVDVLELAQRLTRV
jgi:hypothetical protein